jgi:hypothetical protein
MSLECNISLSDILVSKETLICNKQHYPMNRSLLIVTGKSSSHSIRINAANLKVHFSNLFINTESPLVISGSSVLLIAKGVNELRSTSSINAGIECSDNSNVTLASFEKGSFSVIGGSNSAGIGSKMNGICNSVLIENGSVKATGGTGIGSGNGNHDLSEVAAVTIRSAAIQVKSLYHGSGIGSGSGNYGNSTVINLSIHGGNITGLNSSSGSGIGSGSGLMAIQLLLIFQFMVGILLD